MPSSRTTYVLDRDPQVTWATTRATLFLFNDAPAGSAWNGSPLASYMETTREQLYTRIAAIANTVAPFDTESARQACALLDSLIEARGVWEETKESYGA